MKQELKEIIYDAAFEVRRHLCNGFLEKVYQNALAIELSQRGLQVETEIPIKIHYKGHIVGDYRIDILVENSVILELKSVETILPIHEAQLVNYLTATGINDGILINYGENYIFRHKTRLYIPSNKH